LEVIKLKFFPCCSKKSYRYKEYQEFAEIIYERMDAQSLMRSSGNISFLSTTLLQPYHKILLLELQRRSADMDYKELKLHINEAIKKLTDRVEDVNGNQLNSKVDKQLEKLLEQQQAKIQSDLKNNPEELKTPSSSPQKLNKSIFDEADSQINILEKNLQSGHSFKVVRKFEDKFVEKYF